jgi:Holliday junction resolvasome RuvABC ATP-dependent DNA helicase subunit
MSCQFAAKLEAELRAVPWDVVFIDEAHKLRQIEPELLARMFDVEDV